MATYFLSDEELVEMTDLKQYSKQIQFLSKNNIPFEVSALGRPKVIRSKLEERHIVSRAATRKSIVMPL
jgi:hypothetical protein